MARRSQSFRRSRYTGGNPEPWSLRNHRPPEALSGAASVAYTDDEEFGVDEPNPTWSSRLKETRSTDQRARLAFKFPS